MHKVNIEWLTNRLPVIETIRLRSEPDYYGASHAIAAHLGFKAPPRSFAHWMHGWAMDEDIEDPHEISFRGEPNDVVLVATQTQAYKLKEFGYQKAFAIGMPFIYGRDELHIERKPSSLLVMPSHSSKFSDHSANQEQYAQEIFSLKDHFSDIVVSLHGSCVERNLWIPALQKYNLPWIVGASIEDKNALARMHRIFQSFEFMTTNSMGSHILYASYLGCKVSIFGSYYGMEVKSYQHDPWYQIYPHILKKQITFFKEDNIRKVFPWLFVHPKDASLNTLWAYDKLGCENKLFCQDIAKLLGWTPLAQAKGYTLLISKILNEQGMIGYLKSKMGGDKD